MNLNFKIKLVLAFLIWVPQNIFAQDAVVDRPNILMIAVDDLNNWIGCLGGHPQAQTPNLDRLAASGVLFTNAHCPGAACNPSRSAIMTGRAPNKSGLYDNRQKMREVMPTDEIMPKTFSQHGYWSAGSGKILHYFIDANSWDGYFPKKETENPFPRTLYPENRPVNLPRGGPWQYVETDWAALDATDEEFGGDWLVSKWIGEQLMSKHDQPFYLACGIYRPHEPWFVPKKYYEQFPLENIQLPPGYKADDLEDLPPAGKRRGPNRYFSHIREEGQWKQGIQGYLASIAFADAMVGRVLDALEKSPHKDNTIVVMWSDHGWHLGEKEHWQKYTAWRAVTRVPLMVRVPPGVSNSSIPAGTQPGTICDQPVNLLSVFPTLLDLAKLPASDNHDAPSLLPLLKDADADWPHVSTTFLSRPGEIGLSTKDWRYIRYQEDEEELYHIPSDPHEWRNLASVPQHSAKLKELRELAPQEFARFIPPKVSSLPKLKWHPANKTEVLPSKPEGSRFDVFFVNRSGADVKLIWMQTNGVPRTSVSSTIPSGKQIRQTTRPGAVWLITTPEGDLRGHFVVGDRTSRAIIPD